MRKPHRNIWCNFLSVRHKTGGVFLQGSVWPQGSLAPGSAGVRSSSLPTQHQHQTFRGILRAAACSIVKSLASDMGNEHGAVGTCPAPRPPYINTGSAAPSPSPPQRAARAPDSPRTHYHCFLLTHRATINFNSLDHWPFRMRKQMEFVFIARRVQGSEPLGTRQRGLT